MGKFFFKTPEITLRKEPWNFSSQEVKPTKKLVAILNPFRRTIRKLPKKLNCTHNLDPFNRNWETPELFCASVQTNVLSG